MLPLLTLAAWTCTDTGGLYRALWRPSLYVTPWRMD